jgi:alternate F1F0 ATPase F1 subunit epsilon
MNHKVLLPFQIFAEKTGVSRIVAETREGPFGLLPQRLDCVAALAPGILIYASETDGEVFVTVDEAVLVRDQTASAGVGAAGEPRNGSRSIARGGGERASYSSTS